MWCLYMLCEVAFAFDLATVDCIMTAEMIHTLAILLESAAERNKQTHCSGERVLPFVLFQTSDHPDSSIWVLVKSHIYPLEHYTIH